MPGSRKSIAPSPMPGSKRSALPVRLNSPMAAAAVADVQGAVVEKGVEVMGKMVDKQLQIIDEAQQKAEDFLKKEVGSCYPSKIQIYFGLKLYRLVSC